MIKNDSSAGTISIKRPSDLNQQVGRELINVDIEEQITHFFEASGSSQFSDELNRNRLELPPAHTCGRQGVHFFCV